MLPRNLLSLLVVALHRRGERVGGLAVPAGQRVRLNVRRDGHVGVPEPLAHHHNDALAAPGQCGRQMVRVFSDPANQRLEFGFEMQSGSDLRHLSTGLFCASVSKMWASGQKPRSASFEMGRLERKMGFEPTTLSLARRCSTTEPLPPLLRNVGPLGRHVPRVRIELTTPAFSVLCSTD